MKFENTQVSNFENAFRGMRNPKESWNKSDSFFGLVHRDDMIIEATNVGKHWIDNNPDLNFTKLSKEYMDLNDVYVNKLLKNGILKQNYEIEDVAFIGPNDMKLAQDLIKAGPEHRKFLRQIFVSVDITAPQYFFNELDTYKVATVANSTSKMHKLTNKPITLENFEIDDFDPNLVYYSVEKMSAIEPIENTTGMFANLIIEQLEFLRQKYLETKDKKYWKELIRWLPESWLQTRTWTSNYETIRAMCSKGQRRNHKLNEWSGVDNKELTNFIAWARTLPYAQYFIFDDEGKPF